MCWSLEFLCKKLIYNVATSLLTKQPVIHGEVKSTKYIDSGAHDDSKKLSAFLKTFNYDFMAINDFFTDKFWVTIFEDLSKTKKAIGDSISFEEILSKCKFELAANGIVELDENGKLKGKKEETFHNEENLELGLKNTLKELCEYRVFLKGFNLKCDHCSSQFWYHINEVNDTISCKGCLENFQFLIEPKFAYKLNDLIKNNIYQSSSLRNGNLTVIRTLVNIHSNSYQSFYYSPQLNFFDNHFSNDPCAELDFACLSEGKLVIGEAKHDSKAFKAQSNKTLKSLVEISKAIRPDKIILSCYEDSHNGLDKARKSLIHIFDKWEYIPEIETLQLYSPDYFHLEHHRYFLH